jgi:hypothetical protein
MCGKMTGSWPTVASRPPGTGRGGHALPVQLPGSSEGAPPVGPQPRQMGRGPRELPAPRPPAPPPPAGCPKDGRRPREDGRGHVTRRRRPQRAPLAPTWAQGQSPVRHGRACPRGVQQEGQGRTREDKGAARQRTGHAADMPQRKGAARASAARAGPGRGGWRDWAARARCHGAAGGSRGCPSRRQAHKPELSAPAKPTGRRTGPTPAPTVRGRTVTATLLTCTTNLGS